jgi:hypothetical protein
MRQVLMGWVAAVSVAVGSLAITGTSTGAVVTLNAISGLNDPIYGDQLRTVEFLLPSDVGTINGFTLSFTFDDASTTAAFGAAYLQVVVPQAAPGPGASIFGVVGVDNIAAGSNITITIAKGVGDASSGLTDPEWLDYTHSPLSSTGLWGILAGANFPFFFLNSEVNGLTSVAPRITAASLTLDYNSNGGGGAVPEPSTLAIALVGLAGWRGRRMLRRC